MDFACPKCHSRLEQISLDKLRCPTDQLIFERKDGIWRFLLAEREFHYARFISDYETVRRFEGRGSSSSEYYRALPFVDLTQQFSKDWKIRAASYRCLQQWLDNSKLIPSESTVLDLGAGNSWLSNRLALEGYQVYAIDLLINAQDGLAAWQHYESQFIQAQAEFTRLPFLEASISLAIFNASFHYSENYEQVLSEILRILRFDGFVIVMDSPVYHNATSGEQMVAERKEGFLSRYGFSSDSLQSENYLTYKKMDELAQDLKIRWEYIRPFYGVRWTLRPWLAKLRGIREPAEFGLWIGNKIR